MGTLLPETCTEVEINILRTSVQDLVIFKPIHLSKNEKYQCCIDTVSSPDDGHIFARNMYRSWNKYTKN